MVANPRYNFGTTENELFRTMEGRHFNWRDDRQKTKQIIELVKQNNPHTLHLFIYF